MAGLGAYHGLNPVMGWLFAASLGMQDQTLLAVSLHVGAMLLVMGVVALLVYDKLGVRILRKAWINSDHLWAASVIAAGAITLVT